MVTENQNINCPACGKKVEVDSIRQHRDGRKRIYWECDNCHISIMYRGNNNIHNS